MNWTAYLGLGARTKARRKTLLPRVEAENEDSGLGFMEWVIWAAGEHFEEYFGKDKVGQAEPDAVMRRLQKLSRSNDVRVRKWLATALVDSTRTKDNSHLRRLLSNLARDDDEIVRGQAVGFFLADDGDEEGDT